MKHLSKVEIVTGTIAGRSPDRVLLDGHDITRSVVAHQVHASVGRVTEVHLTLQVADVSTHTAAAVYLDPSTAALLQRHGWTPPDGNGLLLPAHECELEQLRTEVERLKVERGEALAWSPWNDHEVLFEKWAQRRATDGAGEQPPPLPKRVKGTHGPTPEATR